MMARTKKACFAAVLLCVTMWHLGCVGTLSSGMKDNGKFVFSWGTNVSLGHETSKTDGAASVDTTVSLTGSGTGEQGDGGTQTE